MSRGSAKMSHVLSLQPKKVS
jgi:hypothetical protein